MPNKETARRVSHTVELIKSVLLGLLVFSMISLVVVYIGGTSVYEQMLPYCDVAHVTKIDHSYEADAYFPNLDADPEWEITADSDEQYYFDLTYQFLKYERKKK